MKLCIALMLLAVASVADVSTAIAKDKGQDITTCRARRIALTGKVEAYSGDPQLKAVMQADLRRADREIQENDDEECEEALDHVEQLLSDKAS